MKKTTLLKTMLLLCALVVGSMSGWAENVNVLSENFSSNNTTSKLTTAGWAISGTVSAATGYMQIASGSGSGSATTPAFSSLVGTTATLSVAHVSSGAATRTLTIKGVNCKVDGKSSTTVTVNGSGSGANTSTITITEASTSSKITFEAAKNAGTKLNSVTVYYSQASSSPLASIALSGTYPTSFAVGDTFSHEGMTVTATYEDDSEDDVTSKATFTGYNMSTTGTQTVTVSYTEKEVTKTANYSIKVKPVAGLAFSPTSVDIAPGEETTVLFSKTTDATPSFVVADETIATYNSSTGKVVGLKEGTTTITATSAETETYAAGTAVCTITVTDPGWIDLTAQGYNNGDDVDDVNGAYGSLTFDLGTNGNSNNPKWYDTGSAVRLYAGNTIAITANTGFVLASVEFSVTSGSMDASNFSATVSKDGSKDKFDLSTPANSITYSTSSNFRIDKVKLYIAAPVTISDAEYATYCNTSKILDFNTAGIKALIAKDNVTSITLTEIANGQVPANTPVILYKEGATGAAINVPVIASTTTVVDGDANDLRVSDGSTAKGDDVYVLAKNPTIGFYKWTSATSLSEGKIYLKASSGSARDFIGFDSETTGINEIATQKEETRGEYFNLAGQRVAQPTKGLYIVNGKKVIIK